MKNYKVIYLDFHGVQRDYEISAQTPEEAKDICCEMRNVGSFISVALIDQQIKTIAMKTHYEQIEEMLIPLMVVGKISKDVVATILAKVQILETRVKVLEKKHFDLYAESKREDLAQEATYENLTINEGAESESELQ